MFVFQTKVCISPVFPIDTHLYTYTYFVYDELFGKLLAKVPFLSYYGERIKSTYTISILEVEKHQPHHSRRVAKRRTKR